VKWVLLSLRNIADIYDGRSDWAKSKAHRQSLEQLATYLKSEGGGLDAADDESPDFDSIATASALLQRIAGAVLVVIALSVLASMALRKERKPAPRDEPVDMAMLEELARRNHEKAEAQRKKQGARTPRPSRTPAPVPIDESLFNL
jgi:hypothetical protein